jgi:hypothetical protein
MKRAHAAVAIVAALGIALLLLKSLTVDDRTPARPSAVVASPSAPPPLQPALGSPRGAHEVAPTGSPVTTRELAAVESGSAPRARARVVRGRVLGRDGKPFAGARVAFCGLKTVNGEPPPIDDAEARAHARLPLEVRCVGDPIDRPFLLGAGTTGADGTFELVLERPFPEGEAFGLGATGREEERLLFASETHAGGSTAEVKDGVLELGDLTFEYFATELSLYVRSSERAIEGAEVELIEGTGEWPERSLLKTDVFGRARFEILTETAVVVRAPGFVTAEFPIQPLEDGGVHEREVVFERDAPVSGRVTDEHGAPVPRVPLELHFHEPKLPETFRDQPASCARTDEDGRFQLAGAPSRAEVFVLAHPERPDLCNGSPVSAFAPSTDVSIVLLAAGSLRVEYEETPAATEEHKHWMPGMPPWECFQVERSGPRGWEVVHAKTQLESDASALLFQRIPAGRYRVAGKPVALVAPITPVEVSVSAGLEPARARVQLDLSRRTPRGRVVTSSGSPLAKVEVGVSKTGRIEDADWVITRTSEGGTFVVGDLPHEPVVLHFRKAGFMPASQAVPVGATELGDVILAEDPTQSGSPSSTNK